MAAIKTTLGPRGRNIRAIAEASDTAVALIGRKGGQAVRGPRGQSGRRGTRGHTGPRGHEGPEGVAGVAGPVGPVGAVGPAGPVGPTGPAGSPVPTTEHLVCSDIATTPIAPGIDVSFLSEQPFADVPQQCSLAAGSEDGFPKKIVGLTGNGVGYVITPSALEGGTTITINNAVGGAVELVWNAVTSRYQVLAGTNITVT